MAELLMSTDAQNVLPRLSWECMSRSKCSVCLSQQRWVKGVQWSSLLMMVCATTPKKSPHASDLMVRLLGKAANMCSESDLDEHVCGCVSFLV